MGSVVVTGAGTPLGRRVAALLGHTHTVRERPADGDVVVHLSPEGTREVLDGLENLTLPLFVLLSSATVYGAWADNPVPITEDAPMRPNPGLREAAQHAEAERLVAAWAADRPETAVAVLRPAAVITPGADSWLVDALTGQAMVRSKRPQPDRQFVHVDDVASAIDVAVRDRLDGVFNVAPTGGVAAEVVRELGAWRLTVPVPGAFVGTASRWAWALRMSPVPPEAVPLVEHPWVIASDRLQAAGWEPRYTSEEAVVAGRSPSWWREMAPGQRQTAALVATGFVVTSVVTAAAAAVMRARRRVTATGGARRRP
ncbi:MAG TPA: NAD-dependent epimerase/dehydratase family protein [Acidimicrobiales bacterium]|nr:NAD-dependent epimerase/dehydratase family protein [Acidimicrobiales bacterium]